MKTLRRVSPGWKLSPSRPKVAGLVYTARVGVHDASDGYVVALDPATGKPIWQTQVDGDSDGELTEVTAWCTSPIPGCGQLP